MQSILYNRIGLPDLVLADKNLNPHYKLIVYIDSTSCSSCLACNMYIWNGLINEAENTDKKLMFYFE